MDAITVTGGLPYDPMMWGNLPFIRYLLLLLLTDTVCGTLLTRLVEQDFSLHRAGWRLWFRRAMLRAGGCAMLVSLLAGVLDLLQAPQLSTLVGWLVYSLHAIFCAGVQTLLIVSWRSAYVGLLPLLSVQLGSLMLSKKLSTLGKLLLFANWGCYRRSTIFEPEGFPLLAAIAAEVVLISVIWLFGWRFARYVNQRR